MKKHSHEFVFIPYNIYKLGSENRMAYTLPNCPKLYKSINISKHLIPDLIS